MFFLSLKNMCSIDTKDTHIRMWFRIVREKGIDGKNSKRENRTRKEPNAIGMRNEQESCQTLFAFIIQLFITECTVCTLSADRSRSKYELQTNKVTIMLLEK